MFKKLLCFCLINIYGVTVQELKDALNEFMRTKYKPALFTYEQARHSYSYAIAKKMSQEEIAKYKEALDKAEPAYMEVVIEYDIARQKLIEAENTAVIE